MPLGAWVAIFVALNQNASENNGNRDTNYLYTIANPDLTLNKRKRGKAKQLVGKANFARKKEIKSEWMGILNGDI